MNQLIKVQVNDNQEPIVSGRDLHRALGVETPYAKWFSRMTEYGFEENQDYLVTDIFVPNSNGGRQSQKEHILKIPMAKEIAMLQRTPKGKEVRQYFIKVEEEYNSPEKIMARALKISEQTIQSLTEKINEDKPKVLFAESVASSKSSCLIGELAKVLKQNGVNIGQRRLFEYLRENGYLIKRGEDKNKPTQKAMEQGLFQIKKGTYIDGNGSSVTTCTTKVTGKGQIYFVNKFLGSSKQKEERR